MVLDRRFRQIPAPDRTAPIPWRAKKKATTSKSALTARKKYTEYCAVTIPPNGILMVDHERNRNVATKIPGKGHIKAITRK
jgi:hypothetical protein